MQKPSPQARQWWILSELSNLLPQLWQVTMSAFGLQYAGATWSAAHRERLAAGALPTSETVPEMAVIESSSLRAAFWVPCRLRTCRGEKSEIRGDYLTGKYSLLIVTEHPNFHLDTNNYWTFYLPVL